jgi:hypothetical protein
MVDERGPANRPYPEGSMEQEGTARRAPSLAPEHDWAAASSVVRPALRPIGTAGTDGRDLRLPTSGSGAGKPVIRVGPAGLPIVYVIPGRGFDVVVGVDHLLAWGVSADRLHDTAMANLTDWSREADWTDEVNDGRRVIWSDWGEGMDAARILLVDVRTKLHRDLGPGHRVLVGLPERDLLVAARLAEGDDEFGAMFAHYIADRARAADEPIDSRVFELVDGALIPVTEAS